MQSDRVGCCERNVDGPANNQWPDERHDHERRGEHSQAEVRRRDMATGPVFVLIEETEACRQGEQGNGNRGTSNPPRFSQPANS